MARPSYNTSVPPPSARANAAPSPADAGLPAFRGKYAAPRIIYLVTEDWYFLSHRLPMARAARAAGFEVHVATNVGEDADAIVGEGFPLHPVRLVRGRLSPFLSIGTILALRRLRRDIAPVIVHHVALQASVL